MIPSQTEAMDNLTAVRQKPQVTRKGMLLVLFFWSIFTLLSAGLLTWSDQVPFLFSMAGMALSTLIMLLYMIPVWYVLVRELHISDWWVKLALHLPTSLAFTVAWYYSYLGLFDLLFGLEYLDGAFQDEQGWVMFSTFMQYIIVFAVIHVIESLKQLRKGEQQRAELRELSRKREIATLKAQLNPHFLFNTLNSINASVISDPEQAREMIARLSEMLRYSLESFELEQVPLTRELEFIRSYLAMEKTRLGERLEVRYRIDRQLAQMPVPPMICQPLVENAVRHGITPLEEGGTVTVRVTEEGDRAMFCIEDTGAGLGKNPPETTGAGSETDGEGIGLQNTDRMLRKRYGEESALRIEPNRPSGTRVTFSIPANE